MSLKTYFSSADMDSFFTHEYVRAAFTVIDQMNSGEQVWDGWGIDMTGDELAENLLFILETCY